MSWDIDWLEEKKKPYRWLKARGFKPVGVWWVRGDLRVEMRRDLWSASWYGLRMDRKTPQEAVAALAELTRNGAEMLTSVGEGR